MAASMDSDKVCYAAAFVEGWPITSNVGAELVRSLQG